ncbi:MAG: hypothetical protein WAV76_12735 [Bacteroidota bacterium]|jgi:hypothetical protein
MYYLIGIVLVLLVLVFAKSFLTMLKKLVSPELVETETWFRGFIKGPLVILTKVVVIKGWLIRFWVAVKRHLISVALFAVAMTVMWAFSSIDNETIKYLTEMVTAIAVRLSAAILVLKFAFPKFELQERLKNEPIALAIFCGLIVVAVCK